VADGVSLRKACENAGLNVSHTNTAIIADPVLREQYAHARDQRADFIAEQIMTVAHGTLAGRIESDRARVAIDAFKWTASKMAPKRYGERSEHNVNHGVQDSLAELLGQVANSGRPRPGA